MTMETLGLALTLFSVGFMTGIITGLTMYISDTKDSK